MSADAHLEFVTFVFELFDRSVSNIVCFIGDNCNVNLAMASRIRAKYIGCASHRYNIALKDTFKSDESCITKVHIVMKALRRTILAAKLRKYTHLVALSHAPTRWSSTAYMLRRYLSILEFLPDLDLEDHDVALLTTREERKVDALCSKYDQLDSMTKALQSDSVTCADVRAMFDAVIQEFPDVASRLSNTFRVVQNSVLETAIVKLQDNAEASLTSEEATSIENLKIVTLETSAEPLGAVWLKEV